MAVHQRLQGDLQVQIMGALWRIGEGTVEEVRTALPARYRGGMDREQISELRRLAREFERGRRRKR